jgi:DNA-binding transcriptional MerR regulator
MDDAALIRSGEMARRTHVTVRALRIYERRGLIAPVLRDKNGYRYFSPELANSIHVFSALLALGLSLREITAIYGETLPLRDAPTPAQARDCLLRALDVYEAHLRRIDEQLADLKLLKEELLARVVRCNEQLNSTEAVYLGSDRVLTRKSMPGRIQYERPTGSF